MVPRLLLPLQSDGRVLKPSPVHGDCWDGNTAIDSETGEVFVSDTCPFYGHNEYDIGNWRAPRHKLSDPAYIETTSSTIPYRNQVCITDLVISMNLLTIVLVRDWDARNLLYSLPYNLGNAIYTPGSDQREVCVPLILSVPIFLALCSILEDMKALCNLLCAESLHRELSRPKELDVSD